MKNPKTPKKPKKGYSYSLYQNGLCTAKVFSYSKAQAEREILHYENAYATEGPTQIIRRRAK